jgi:hypothetical protein
MIKNIHIFDLDGTLVDSSHRYRTLNNGQKLTIDINHWFANSHKFESDSLLPLAEFYQDVNADLDTYTIWITARNEKHFNQTYPWLVEKMGAPNKAFCRPGMSNESGALLKRKQLKSFLSLKQFAKAKRYFYEDNKAYLAAVCPAINAEPVYIESKQGH